MLIKTIITIMVGTLVSVGVTGCSNDESNGSSGTNGLTSLVKVTVEPAGSNCAAGGQKLESGIDNNNDTILSGDEITSTQYICNSLDGMNGSDGTNAINALINTAIEPSGSNCVTGGYRIDIGLDDNNNTILEEIEVDSTQYACNGIDGTDGINGSNGTDGVDGTNGTNGINALINTIIEPSGANCVNGGYRIDIGQDDNNNTVLEPIEVGSTQYACNGMDGQDGADTLTTLIETTVVSVGDTNCSNGGFLFTSGLDDNNNSILESAEIDVTQYVCNGTDGVDGSNGTNGLTSLVSTEVITTGDATCVNGGFIYRTGLDDNNNSILEPIEVDKTNYLCNGVNGQDGADGLTTLVKTTTLPVGDGNCSNGGFLFTSGLDDNNNSVLDPIEVDSTQYLCNGTENLEPVANAGLDQNTSVGKFVFLDANMSFDPENNPLTYQWSIISKPVGSNISLSDATGIKPYFVVDVEGSYVFSLVVRDGFQDSLEDTVKVTTQIDDNHTPIANAGNFQNINVSDVVPLDASKSYDPNGDALTFSWILTAKPADSMAVLSNGTVVNPEFTADKAGDYFITLVVNDGVYDSIADTVKITANVGNVPPVAEINAIKYVKTGMTVELDGSLSSDHEGALLTYSWVLVSKPMASLTTLTHDTWAQTEFVADIEGSYVLELVVNDGTTDSTPETMTITASSGNSRPVANAGRNQNVTQPYLVLLDGTLSSDVDNDSLTYAWSIVSKPAGSSTSIIDANTSTPKIVADVDGTFVLSLVVNDGTLDSEPSNVKIVASSGNSRPVADAGRDDLLSTPSFVQLYADGSSDADGNGLSYQWHILAKPDMSTAVLNDTSRKNPTFTVDQQGTYVFSLVVFDGLEYSDKDVVTIQAKGDGKLWTEQYGSIGDESVKWSVLDSEQNIYILGNTDGDINGNSSVGLTDVFVSKHNQDGSEQWVLQFGTTDSDTALSMAIDSNDNLFVVGYTTGEFIDNNQSGLEDLFLSKISSNGVLLWTKQYGSTEDDRAARITIDSDDNIYIAGNTKGDLGSTNSGDRDILIMKYTVDGDQVWIKQYGSSLSDYAKGIVIDSNNSLFLIGTTYGDIDNSNISSGGTDTILSKFTLAGNIIWTKQYGTDSNDFCKAIAIDSKDNIYITGITYGDFSGSGNAGQNDIYLTKVSADGDTKWITQYGSTQRDFGNALVLDEYDNIYVAGSTNGSLEGNNAFGGYDVFLSRFNFLGTIIWTRQFGTDSDDYVKALVVDSENNLYMSGSTFGSLDGHTNLGQKDALIIKMDY